MKTLSVEDLERAIDNADVCAMVELGKRFCYGDGVEKNFGTAKELFQKAADLEDADGETWLARCLLLAKASSETGIWLSSTTKGPQLKVTQEPRSISARSMPLVLVHRKISSKQS